MSNNVKNTYVMFTCEHFFPWDAHLTCDEPCPAVEFSRVGILEDTGSLRRWIFLVDTLLDTDQSSYLHVPHL